MKVFFLSIILMTIVLLLLGVRIILSKLLFNKRVKFINTSIGKNNNMKTLGISCTKHDEQKCYDREKQGLETSNGLGSSCGCG